MLESPTLAPRSVARVPSSLERKKRVKGDERMRMTAFMTRAGIISKGVPSAMNSDDCARGRRVRITNESPFRGSRGTIQCVHPLGGEGDEDPFCWYLIALDLLQEPLWFEQIDIEILDLLPHPVAPCEIPGQRKSSAPDLA